jgi:hypothetical protein
MKIAVIIHGEPRFCEDFDYLIKSLEHIDGVDWFFYLWNKNPYPAPEQIKQERTSNPYPHTYGFNLVAPAWRDVDPAWSLKKLKENLPSNHNIISVGFADHHELEFDEPPTENYAQEVSIVNICKNWYSMKQVDLLRQNHEKENNFKYDFVIRSRADIAVTSPLDLEHIKERIDNENNIVLIPMNRLCGYDGVNFCDLYAIASSNNMSIYTDLINQAWQYNREGVIFHGETMLANHLIRSGLHYTNNGFTVELRWQGEHFVEPEKIYISKFGRWA